MDGDLRPGVAQTRRLLVNGTARAVAIEPWVMPCNALRERLGLFGAKKGCDHGQGSSGEIRVRRVALALVPVQADVPRLDATMLDRPDLVASPALGAKGCREVGNVGIAAAIASAVFNATGVRVRDLSILLEELLTAGLARPGRAA